MRLMWRPNAVRFTPHPYGAANILIQCCCGGFMLDFWLCYYAQRSIATAIWVNSGSTRNASAICFSAGCERFLFRSTPLVMLPPRSLIVLPLADLTVYRRRWCVFRIRSTCNGRMSVICWCREWLKSAKDKHKIGVNIWWGFYEQR